MAKISEIFQGAGRIAYFIPQIVSGAAKGVYVAEVLPEIARNQARNHGEIFIVFMSEPPGVGPGGVDVRDRFKSQTNGIRHIRREVYGLYGGLCGGHILPIYDPKDQRAYKNPIIIAGGRSLAYPPFLGKIILRRAP